ncbi:MAG: ABC transporter ATP-binding protein [Thermomicrobiales bacterium]
MAFLELTDLQKSFGPTVAVERLSLGVDRGAFVTLLGPSGCGKTTTLRMIAGFESPTAGTITVDGAEITRQPVNRRNIGVVFQSYALFPNMTVADNVAFGLKVRKRPRQEIVKRVAELLALVELEAQGRRYPHQLSGGQQQRVALARALAIEPQILLLDEPLSALDARIRVSLRNEIRRIQRQLKITTIYVTHDQEEALSLSDQIVVMNKGRIEQIGTPFQIYNFPRTHFVASFVGTLNVLPATVVDAGRGVVRVGEQLLSGVVGVRERRAGEVINLALRPETIAMVTDPDTPNQLRGVVEDAVFLGALVRVRVRVGETLVNLDLLNRADLVVPTPGDTIRLACPAEACLVLDTETALPLASQH